MNISIQKYFEVILSSKEKNADSQLISHFLFGSLELYLCACQFDIRHNYMDSFDLYVYSAEGCCYSLNYTIKLYPHKGLHFSNRDLFVFSLFQYAIKLATKLNEKRLSSITELTTMEDKPIKLVESGHRDKDRDKDNRDREREWNYKNINQNHITNNHQSVANHTSHVSFLSRFLIFFFCLVKNILNRKAWGFRQKDKKIKNSIKFIFCTQCKSLLLFTPKQTQTNDRGRERERRNMFI